MKPFKVGDLVKFTDNVTYHTRLLRVEGTGVVIKLVHIGCRGGFDYNQYEIMFGCGRVVETFECELDEVEEDETW